MSVTINIYVTSWENCRGLDIISSLGISGVNTSKFHLAKFSMLSGTKILHFNRDYSWCLLNRFFSIYDLVVCTHSPAVKLNRSSCGAITQKQIFCFYCFCPRPVFSEVASFFRNANGNQLSLTARPASVTFDIDRSD